MLIPDSARSANARRFLVIWAARFVARTSNGLTAFGLAVYAYRQTGLSTSVALVMISAFLPGVLLAPLGGVLADRFDRRLLMIFGDVASGLVLIGLLAIVVADSATVPMICLCVAVSSVFASVMEPAYRSTVTDLLTPEQYARAGGLVQLAAASQYLISPALAGVMMVTVGLEAILLVDIATMLVTVVSMAVVWRGLRGLAPAAGERAGFWTEFRLGATYFLGSRGVLVLMLLITLVTFCMGFLQTLLTPMMLELTTEDVLGRVVSFGAAGMVVSALLISVFSMGNRHTRYLGFGLAAAAVFIVLLGGTTSILLIAIFAFLFFMTLPLLNTSIEVLVRGSIPNEVQGRVWGIMGLVSQLGYIVAYAVSGPLADLVFTPFLLPGGTLADTVGAIIGTAPSRGIGLMFMLVGGVLAIVAIVIARNRSVREMESALTNTGRGHERRVRTK